MSILVAAIAHSQPPAAGAGLTYVQRVNALSPDWYLLLAETGGTTAAAEAGAVGTYVNSPQLGVTSIAQDDASGKSVGLSGATTSTPHLTATSPLSGASFTLHMLVQLDSITKAKHVLATHSGGAAIGQMSLEVLTGGQVRAWSDDATTFYPIVGSVGDVPQGEAVSIVYQRQSNVVGWSQRVYVDGVLKAEDATQRTWDAFASGTFYLGTWFDGASFLDPTDGLVAHVAGWNSLLSPVQIADLARAQSVAWAEDIDAGAVQASAAVVVNVRQGGWHGKLPLTATAGDGALVTTTESGEEITVTAGATPGTDDTFSYSFTDDDGRATATKTVTIDVSAAPAGVSLGALTAFQPSRIQVTGLAGWPAGRTPKEVVTQGTYAHGYVRRSWKPTNNDGTWMDFQAGWRKTTAADVIRIKLDDNSELDLSYTVAHALPAPGSGGTTRTLDKLGGADFTTWTSAIAGCANNDVLVVRAQAGGEVYPIDLNVGGAVSTASGVKVVAHPDDLAAGRRPRIHVQGTKFAKFADDLGSAHWIVDTDLGTPHGKVWKSAATISSPVNVGCSYRTLGGGVRRCYTYTNTSGTPGALARLRDKTYPRVSTGTPSQWALYVGPGIYWHSTDQRLYIRLSPLVNGVGAIQVNNSGGQPNPPWDWSDDDPENEDPNQCQLFISSTNNQNSPGNVSTNISYNLRINGEADWTLENLDFVGGGNTIEMRDGSNHTLRGCRVLGWAPPNMQDSPTQSTVGQVHNMLECENSFGIVADRCEFWGGAAPWVGHDENKARHGAYSIPQKGNLFWMQGATGTISGSTPNGEPTISIRFLNCLIDGYLNGTRPGGVAQYVKFHQSELRYWGTDGSLAMKPPTESIEYLRCRLIEATLVGMTGATSPDGKLFLGYSLWINVRPFLHENGWWDTLEPAFNQFVCAGQDVSHGSEKACDEVFCYQITSIGSHNHRDAATVVGAADGAGARIFPWSHIEDTAAWTSRNCILAVYPNGSTGFSGNTTVGQSGDSHAGIVYHPNGPSIGASISQDYNLYFRDAGMPAQGQTGVITTRDSGGTVRARNSITDVRNDTGQEMNGKIADPAFVAAWDSGLLDTALHANARYLLAAGSAARTGGDTTDRTWPDTDFGVEITYPGHAWLGCMEPDVPSVEQQVGPLGPMIT